METEASMLFRLNEPIEEAQSKRVATAMDS